MHTVDLLEQALALATRLGYQVRQEWLSESGGGACEYGGRKWLFVDLSLSSTEQLSLVVDALRHDRRLDASSVPSALSRLLKSEKAA